MPELPEVQTIVNDLNRKIKGGKIIDFWTDWKKSVKLPLNKFKREIIGHKITKAERRGKNIFLYLDNGKIMLIHLKMTGHLLVKTKQTEKRYQKYFQERVNQYIHHIWTLRKGKKDIRLEFSDLRKFGKIELFPNQQALWESSEIKNLGAEPLAADFTLRKLKTLLIKRPQSQVRTFLMDQKNIAGIGNIYASEILFVAGIKPQRTIKTFSEQEIKALHQAIKKVLKKAVTLRGTSDADYRDTKGAPGGFQNVLKVYNREGKPCQKRGCQGIVKRVKMNQRSAY